MRINTCLMSWSLRDELRLPPSFTSNPTLEPYQCTICSYLSVVRDATSNSGNLARLSPVSLSQISAIGEYRTKNRLDYNMSYWFAPGLTDSCRRPVGVLSLALGLTL